MSRLYSFTTIKSTLLFVQILISGFLLLGCFMMSVSGEESSLAKVLYPLRSLLTVFIITISFFLKSGIPFKIRFVLPLLYCLYLLVTSAWSPDGAATIRAALDFGLTLLSLTILCNGLPPRRTVSCILTALAVTMTVSALVAIALPASGRMDASSAWTADQVGAWRGTFGEKNGLGCTAAISICGMVAGWRQWRLNLIFKLVAFASSLICLMEAHSANAFIGLVAMVLSAILLAGRRSRWVVIFIWAAIGLVIFVAATTPLLILIFEAAGRDPTASNRTLIWSDALTIWQRSPIFGLGFVQGTLLVLQPYLFHIYGQAARHAHSGYIEVMVETGVIGLTIFLTTFLVGLWRCSYRPSRLPAEINNSAIFYQTILIGSLAMAGGDVLSFRLSGGFGVVTWCVLIACYSLRRGLSAPPIPVEVQ